MKCKNCGAEYSDKLSKCPYCGTMNRKAAYREFKEKVAGFFDRVLGLKAEAYDSISKMLLLSILRSLILIIVVCALAFGASFMANVNYYEDVKYDRETFNDISWENENLRRLNECFENGDFEAIRKLYVQRRSVVTKWEHYSSYELQTECKKIMSEKEFNQFVLQDIIYFSFFPDYYADPGKLSEEEKEIYEENRAEVLALALKEGYSEEELEEIYENVKDAYGYFSATDLEGYLKEGE